SHHPQPTRHAQPTNLYPLTHDDCSRCSIRSIVARRERCLLERLSPTSTHGQGETLWISDSSASEKWAAPSWLACSALGTVYACGIAHPNRSRQWLRRVLKLPPSRQTLSMLIMF